MKKARKGEVKYIGVIVDKFLSKYSIAPNDYALRVFFSEFIGPKLSKYCELVKFLPDGPIQTKSTVFILTKTAVVKNEIILMRRKIIKVLNEFLGSDKIKDLKIVDRE
ncbi:MAG: DciA family protein [Elusimicrobiota bacterium]